MSALIVAVVALLMMPPAPTDSVNAPLGLMVMELSGSALSERLSTSWLASRVITAPIIVAGKMTFNPEGTAPTLQLFGSFQLPPVGSPTHVAVPGGGSVVTESGALSAERFPATSCALTV